MTNSSRPGTAFRGAAPAPGDATLPSRRPSAAFDLLLTSGGDERIWPDPVTRRNRYGVPTLPQPDELWFSSSTASAITPRAHSAARRAFEKLTGANGGAALDPASWFDDLRARIVGTFGVPGTDVVLSASGTEAELLALTLAKAILRRPLTNIVIAPDETGSGVMHAAAGTHFADTATFEASVAKGRPLAGWENEPTLAIGVAMRGEAGRPRDPCAIAREVGARVETALQDGRDVLLHVLDASKTGRSGPTRAIARAIADAAGDRVLVVVDACQLRCSVIDIQADLRSGFLVMITGSKFAAGPPFCGALLIPPGRAGGLRGLQAPPGLAAYSAKFDWPVARREALGRGNFAAANLGMGLRWEAALSEIEAFAAVPEPLREKILAAFADETRRRAVDGDGLSLLDARRTEIGGKAPSILPIVTGDGDVGEARRIYDALRAPQRCADQSRDRDVLASVCHVGQPVVVGNRAALRMCASMPTTVFVAERVAKGMDLERAFQPVKEDIERIFRKWELVRRKHSRSSEAKSVFFVRRASAQ